LIDIIKSLAPKFVLQKTNTRLDTWTDNLACILFNFSRPEIGVRIAFEDRVLYRNPGSSFWDDPVHEGSFYDVDANIHCIVVPAKDTDANNLRRLVTTVVNKIKTFVAQSQN